VAGADAIATVEQKAKDLLAQADAYRQLSSNLAHDDAGLEAIPQARRSDCIRSYVQGRGRGAWQEMPTPAIGPNDALVRPTVVATCTPRST
jgi:hypothetical protein